MSIIIFLVILALLILVHEFGHFIVAKKSGIRVDEFGLGFPPKVFSKKYGETLYTLNMIPFGGFVKIFGEDPHAETISETDKHRSFFYKPKWIQSLVLVAGVTFNIIFAWVLISLGFMIGLPAPIDHSGFGEVRDARVVITEVIPNSPAQNAGLRTGDTIILARSGQTVLQSENLTPANIQELITQSDDAGIAIEYKRGELEQKEISITPDTTTVEGRKAIGVSMDSIGILQLPVHLALLEGANTTWLLVEGTALGLFSFLWDALTLQSDLSQVAGPVGIAGIVSEAKTLGFVYLLSLTALISINLALINLLPFPALDGGRLLFVVIEAIIRRPINPSFVQWANVLGFSFLIILMVVITVSDILKLF